MQKSIIQGKIRATHFNTTITNPGTNTHQPSMTKQCIYDYMHNRSVHNATDHVKEDINGIDQDYTTRVSQYINYQLQSDGTSDIPASQQSDNIYI